MAFTTFTIPGPHTVIVLDEQLKTAPVYEYEQGKRTDKQKVDEAGHRLWRLDGLAVVIEGNTVRDGTIYVTAPWRESQRGKIGAKMRMTGDFKARSGSGGFGLTGTLYGGELQAEEGEKRA